MSPIVGVFPGQLSAIISLFLWNPSKAEPEKPLSLGNTVGLTKGGPVWRKHRGVEYPSPQMGMGRSEFLLLALLLYDS